MAAGMGEFVSEARKVVADLSEEAVGLSADDMDVYALTNVSIDRVRAKVCTGFIYDVAFDQPSIEGQYKNR